MVIDNEIKILNEVAMVFDKNGEYTIIDAFNIKMLEKYEKCYIRNGRVRYWCVYDGEKQILLHNLFTGKKFVDHINRNTFDNRMCNLRPCTNRENILNSGPHKDSVVKYKGVSLDKKNKKYKARIFVNGKEVWIGRFDTPEDAAIAYDKMAKRYFGDFAYLNFGGTKK